MDWIYQISCKSRCGLEDSFLLLYEHLDQRRQAMTVHLILMFFDVLDWFNVLDIRILIDML